MGILQSKYLPGGKVDPPKKVFFFDIDNCLYPKSAKVHEKMAELINVYFSKHLNLDPEEAVRLHKEYYQKYGLAIAGLVMNHQVDPLEFNAQVDDKLPLDILIEPRPELHRLLESIDRSQVKLWLFTNAYKTHAWRVVRVLGLEGMFEGLTYCDYASLPFLCKPGQEIYAKAMSEAGVDRVEDCYFVDDSFDNCVTGERLGWNTVLLAEEEKEPGTLNNQKRACAHKIRHLEELYSVFPELFKCN